ncbi:hypothetical protein [Streptomyces sp. RG80]|uniref:hypothetical protein n=1 Tax=Streptomyces sp. RG80 TaxID=3157340 RepID=UPI00338DE73C
MAADLQLTEFLHGLLTAAIAAGVEAGASGVRTTAEVLGLAADLAGGVLADARRQASSGRGGLLD